MKPNFIMLVGLPASGKSTYAKTLKDNGYIIHSSDAIREELLGDINDQSDNTLVFRTLHKRIKTDLSNGKNVVYDATNISPKRRKAFLNEIKKIECTKIAIFMATAIEVCLNRNLIRDRVVPEEVIKNMYLNCVPPMYWEGWDEISIIYDENSCSMAIYELARTIGFNQNNPHHKYTLGKHMALVSENVMKHSEDYCLSVAAMYHDIGKPYTEMKDYNNISHYYNHQNVSAYLFVLLFFKCLSLDDLIDIYTIIALHMLPYNWCNETDIKKAKQKYGELLVEDLIILHKADMNG